MKRIKASKTKRISQQRSRKKLKRAKSYCKVRMARKMRKYKGWLTAKLIKGVFVRHFPEFMDLIKELPDDRDKSATKYSVVDIIMSAIFLFITKAGSRNQANLTADEDFKDNLCKIFNFNMPHMDTVNRFLESLPAEALENMLKSLVSELIRNKVLHVNHEFDDCHLVAIDGSGDGPAKEGDEGTTSKTSKLGTTTFSRSFLLASLLTPAGFSIPIAAEWIVTEDGMTKQDCELNAFKRLAEKIKEFFPRLRICLLLDALYPNASVFEICKNYRWHFACSVKNNLKSVVNSANQAIEGGTGDVNQVEYPVDIDGKIRERYVTWVSGIQYEGHILTVIFTTETKADETEVRFSYVSSIEPKKRTIKSFICGVRCRWNIEDTFNTLKNRGFNSLHKFSRTSFQAHKNWRMIMLIGLLIEQLVVMSKNISGAFDRANDTFKNLWESVVLFLSCPDPEPIIVPPRMKFSYFR